MNLKAHAATILAVAAICGTQIACTAWIVDRIHYESPDYGAELSDVRESLDEIARGTEQLKSAVDLLDTVAKNSTQSEITLRSIERQVGR